MVFYLYLHYLVDFFGQVYNTVCRFDAGECKYTDR